MNSRNDATAPGERDHPVEEPDLSQEQNEHLTRSLRAVRNNPATPPALQDLARKMLGGRLELKDVLDDPAGHRALTEGLAGISDSWRSMSPQDRQAVRAQAAQDPDEQPRPGPAATGR
ncbi:hypothetical protein [Streptomyces pinistramenti]|uniref:hypothetical protein n=1 Tax=Streptomyces pinistramenti TaxID=2884812 RepID=UPI001D0833A3|nr:hypothetical protein [Streptomyces pinistramenti]MCB5911953.1 hypothetical protein [Streptomyces pinistramenti]